MKARHFVVCVGMALSLAVGRSAYAAQTDSAELFDHARDAIKSGAYQDAIDSLESLSDRGVIHPSVSFNRALAYMGRASTPQKKSGDLGQAAAALEETTLLDPQDQEAAVVLANLRTEIAREQAKGGNAPLNARPTLGRAIVDLCSENTWLILGQIGSVLLAAGLLLRRWFKAVPAQIAALPSIAMGAVLFAVGAGLAFSARSYRLHSTPAVVIVSGAHLLSESGAPASAGQGVTAEFGEGSRVDITETRGALSRIAWGGSDGWVSRTQLRRLQTP
jgi:hypothetical protein